MDKFEAKAREIEKVWSDYEWSSSFCEEFTQAIAAALREAAGEATADHARLKAQLEIARETLNQIRDGGVPEGVLANCEERMLVMCGISSEALIRIGSLNTASSDDFGKVKATI